MTISSWMSQCRLPEDVPFDLGLEDEKEFYQEKRWEKTFPKRGQEQSG